MSSWSSASLSGKLGARNECAQYTRAPSNFRSDYMDVVYVRFDDAGGWRLTLARELKAAGFSIDMNDAI